MEKKYCLMEINFFTRFTIWRVQYIKHKVHDLDVRKCSLKRRSD